MNAARRCLLFIALGVLITLATGIVPGAAQTPDATTARPPGTPEQPQTPEPSLFLPLVSGEDAAREQTPTSPVTTQIRIVQAVAGLAGTLERNPTGGSRLRTSAGNLYVLVPATTLIDARLATLVALAPVEVRVGGTLYSAGRMDRNPFVVVASLVTVSNVDEGNLPARTPVAPIPSTPRPVASPATPAPTTGPEFSPTPTTPPTPTFTATPAPPVQPALVATGRFDAVNLHAGPDIAYERTGRILLNQRCNVIGRNASGSWIQIECPAVQGWIEPRLVTVSGDVMVAPVIEVAAPTPTVTPTMTPRPLPTAIAYSGWRAAYFANTILAGLPVAVDDLPAVDLNWGAGSPRAGVPADGFSIRFERVVDFAPAYYFFTVDADDGVRVFIDDALALDQFGGMGGQIYRFGRPLSGPHTIRIEYVEFTGDARVRFVWEGAQADRWSATYTGLPNASGGVVTRMEPDGGQFPLDYNWGTASPTGMYATNWLARWEASYSFVQGNYLFFAQADDGVRLYLDDTLVLDKWFDGYGEVRNRFVGVGGGERRVRVEYYQRAGNARIRVWWIRETQEGARPE